MDADVLTILRTILLKTPIERSFDPIKMVFDFVGGRQET